MPVHAARSKSHVHTGCCCGLFAGLLSTLGLRNSPRGTRAAVPTVTTRIDTAAPDTTQLNSFAMSATGNGESRSEKKISKSTTNGTSTTVNGYSHSNFQQVTVVREVTSRVHIKLQGQFSSSVDGPLSSSISIENFLDYVAAERLRRMPHRGSKWDKVLKWAEYFASQVSIYQDCVSAFLPHSKEAAQLVWGCCRALLEMGPGQAAALERAFGVFYQLGLTLSFFLRNHRLFSVSGEIRQELGHAYADLLTFVTDVTVYYRKRSKAIDSIDFDSHFGRTVDMFFQHRDQIANAMWTCQLQHSAGLGSTTVDIQTIRQWLAPQDRTLQILFSNRMGTRIVRDEYTCEWFQKELLDFTRSDDDILVINGKSGCGKSVLSGWIVERLQRPLGRKSYETISYVIDADIPSQTTSLSIVKGLLLQLLEQSVGDVSLYKSLHGVLELSKRTSNASKIEPALWRALDTAVKTSNNLMIVVDGLDEVMGGQSAALPIFERLHEITAAKHNTVKTIVLSRPFPKLPRPARQFAIDPTHTHDDIHHLVERSLNLYHHFHHQKQSDKEVIIERITHSANGSFLWAALTAETLKKEETHGGFMHVLEKAPSTLAETLQKLVSTLDLTRNDTKLILSWLLVAERPLSLIEIQNLLEVDVGKHKHVGKIVSIKEDIIQACGSLLVIRDGIVRFRHITVRQHLQELATQGKLISSSNAQQDLTIRILAYAKTYLTRRHEPSLEPLEPQFLDELFQSHRLLEYTVRYWTAHFSLSPMHKPSGSHSFPSEFKAALPDSTLLALIEGTCWEAQTSATEAVEMHTLALKIRQSVFTHKSESVLQCQITVACTYEKLSNTIEASKYYYQASRLSRTILSKQSTLAFTCATAYLTCTTSVTTTTRTEITNQKEEMLKYVIEIEKHTHGTTSEVVIKYSKLLAELYVQIQETELAAIVYREVYQACVERYGKSSEEVTSISQILTMVLQTESKREDVTEYTRSFFEITEKTMEVIDIRRIKATIRLTEIYEAQEEYFAAEEIYVSFWRKVIEVCRLTRSIESHERKIQITIEYVRFLRRRQRIAEAESILLGLWAEYEHEVITSETLVIYIKSIGVEMREIGILAIALSVFTSVWSYFKKSNRQTSIEASSTAVLLVEVTQEMSARTETTINESVLIEVFESTISTSTTSKVEITTVKTCETLSTYYARHERWADASKICQKLLRTLWPTLITDQSSVVLSKSFTLEAIEVSRKLAYYYIQERRIEEAEKVYLYIFRATKSHLRVQDDLVAESGTALFEFYENLNQISKAIGVYKELAEEYRRTLGLTHVLTTKLLYRLGDLCTRHKQKDADRYYLEIVTSLNKGLDFCHREALEATIILSKIYYEEKRWSDAQKLYITLWQTITKRCKEYDISTKVVETTYQRYVYILEKEIKVEYSVLRQVTVEYRETCVKVFGARSEITLKATMRLAEICERSEKYQQEAILIYEEVFRETKETTTSTSILSILTEAKQRLAHLYVTTVSSSSTHSEKAVTLYLERYKHTKTEYGCSHESTLTNLKELVILYKKQNTSLFQIAAIRELQSFTIEVITTVKDSKKLFDSGVALAATYTSCGYKEQGYDLLMELRRQIIAKDISSSKDFGFEVASVDRRSYVFLVVFEETLKGTKKISCSEVMAELLTESILYEHYNRSTKRQTSFETILLYGARLRSFLISKERRGQATKLEDELYEMFQVNMGPAIKTNRKITRIFFIVLLEELGEDKHDVQLGNAACIAGNAGVLAVLNKGKFQEAYDLASCVHQFAMYHHSYQHTHNYDYGFKLSLYLAGRGAKRCPDQELRAQMLELSKTILREALGACKSIQVNFVQIPIKVLNDLVGLMGEQKNYEDLEWLLTELWNSRHSQSSWSSATIVWIGRRLVEVRFAHKHRDSAIHLCEDICYNLRRVWGPLDPTTIEMSILLSKLYTTAGRYHKAMGVHEEILRQEISDETDEPTAHNAAQTALTHLELLKRSYQRLGGWEKDPQTYKDLYSQLVNVFGKEQSWQDVQSIDKWSNKGADAMGTFTAPTTWEFISREEGKKHHNLLRRISENWAVSAMNGQNGDHRE